jgi:glycosyltransferase involved in cell wall biosynthesis
MAARRRGLDASAGDLVVFLDGDDRLRPDALARFARGFGRHPDVGAVYGDRVLMDAAGRVFGSERGALWNPRPSGDVLERLLVRPFLSTPGQICIRRATLRAVERWPRHVRRAADWVLLGQLAAMTSFAFVGRGPVVEYRMAPGSMARSLAAAGEAGIDIRETEPALDELFEAPAIVRRLAAARRVELRRRAEASAFAWKGQELLRARKWSRARAYFREALQRGSRDPRDVFALGITLIRAFPPGTRRWIGMS